MCVVSSFGCFQNYVFFTTAQGFSFNSCRYGNEVPVTIGGRAMVFTIGFVTILVFGSIESTAGFIVSGCFDDILVRLNLRWYTMPWVSCIIWGVFYYGWIVLIGLYTKSWKHSRLGLDSFSFYDGLWFSYISSTTIGKC